MKIEDKINELMKYLRVERVCKAYVEEEKTSDRVNINIILGNIGLNDEFKVKYLDSIKDYIDSDGYFNKDFGLNINSICHTISSDKLKYKLIRDNADFEKEIEIADFFDIENTLKTVKLNPNIIYKIKKDVGFGKINFSMNGVQYVTINPTTDSREIPFVISIEYNCPTCGNILISEEKFERGIKCKKCKNDMVENPSKEKRMTFYSLRVDIDGSERDIVSLVPLPLFNLEVACIPYMSDKDYTMLVLAYNKLETVKYDLVWKDGNRLKQMVVFIKDIINKNLSKEIVGMDYIIAGLLLGRIASACGFVNFNILLVGDHGTGKTTISELVTMTMAEKLKVQPASRMSIPGLCGSSSTITIDKKMFNIFQQGMLTRCCMCVIDEYYDIKSEAMSSLKSFLSGKDISSELHNNRGAPKAKTAVVVASGNIPDEHIKDFSNRYSQTMGAVGAQDSKHIKDMPDVIKLKFSNDNKCWVDGVDFANIDRFPLVFYILDSGKLDTYSGDEVELHSQIKHKRLYCKDVEDYIIECSKIKFDRKNELFREYIKKLTLDFYTSHYDVVSGKDFIHSQSRLRECFENMLVMMAKINNRDYCIEDDYNFVKELYGKTCKLMYNNQLSWDVFNDDARNISTARISNLNEIKDILINYIGKSEVSSLNDIHSHCVLAGLKTEDVIYVLKQLVDSGILSTPYPNSYAVKK